MNQQMLQSKPSCKLSSLGFSWQPPAWVSGTWSSIHFFLKFKLNKLLSSSKLQQKVIPLYENDLTVKEAEDENGIVEV